MPHKRPILLQGTRDYGPTQLYKRAYIFDTIRKIAHQYGFLPLETPALEHLSTLTGKYGQEGEQLIFKVLKSGNFLAGIAPTDFEQDYKGLGEKIAEKGLRYDLTVPLMRYIVMNQHQLTFPFRRYQMQPVWRADRPQKGRYREFHQCDVDIVGTRSLISEAEIVAMIHAVLQKLSISHFSIQLNHRALLKGITTLIGEADKENAFCVAVDKLDKMGQAQVFTALSKQGFSSTALEKLQVIFALQGTNEAKLNALESHVAHSKEGRKGVNDLKKILQYVKALGLEAAALTLDPTLVRGLTYYTGTIFEVKVHDVNIGSIGGGGRYDNLTDIFGLPDVSGVGFSFGIDRIYAVMEALQLFPQSQLTTTQVMLTNMDSAAEKLSLSILAQLRAQAIKAEIYPEPTRLKKQLHYADKKNIPFVVIIGTEAQETGQLTLKDMHTGIQQKYTLDSLMQALT